jgi:hypothetical protein
MSKLGKTGPERIIESLSEAQKNLLKIFKKHKGSYVEHGVCATGYDYTEWKLHKDSDDNEIEESTPFKHSVSTLKALKRRGILDFQTIQPNIYTDVDQYWLKKEFRKFI